MVEFSAFYLWRAKEHKILEKQIKELKNQSDFVDYSVVLIKLISRREKASDFIRLHGILKLNMPYMDRSLVSKFSLLTKTVSKP